MENIFSTLLFISFICCIALFFINIIMNKNPYLVLKRHHFFLICLIIISIRLLLPFDFPIVKAIKIKEILPDIFLFLYKSIYTFLDFPVSVFNILTLIWVTGIFICLMRILYSYRSLIKIIHGLFPYEDEVINKIMASILKHYKKPIDFQLVTTDRIMTPVIFGMKKPYIIIPKITLSEKEWSYVLAHEIKHFYQGDMYLKFLFEIFHAIYWWNPLYYIIKKYISTLLEINIDLKVSKQFKEIEKLSYLECLLKVARGKNAENTIRFASSFNGDSPTQISKRIHIVMNDAIPNKYKYHSLLSFIITFILTLCVLIIPNFYTMVPDGGIPPDIQKETLDITAKNAYYIQLSNNTYDLYVDGNFLINVDSPDIFKESITIYPYQEVIINE